MPKLFTIGFTQKSAAQFFELLQKAGAKIASSEHL